MSYNIEYYNGRISAFTEIEELLSYINPRDKTTADKLKILIEHIGKQIESNEHYINDTLELMEGMELLRR